MRITDYPDLLRTKGKEPMPQAWDAGKQDWTPAIDSAATLKALREALGAPTDATQADPAQEATAIALLKGLVELANTEDILAALRTLTQKNYATEQTLAQIKQTMAEGIQRVELTGTLTELFGASLSDRPPASSVSVGATFMVVGTDIVYQSNGTDWVVIS